MSDKCNEHITTDERVSWNNKAEKSTATQAADGLMSKEDKGKLDNITKPATIGFVIQEDDEGIYIEI